MTKQDFLNELREALSGNVEPRIMLENVQYYSNYIEEQILFGKRESEVLEELGKPSLIARTIIDANNRERSADEVYTEDGKTKRYRHREYTEQPKQKRAEEEIKKQKEFHFHFDPFAWYAKILYVLILILLILIVFFILQGVFYVLIQFGIPILLILGIIYLIMYFSK